jgi:hypothetical protein
MPTIVLPFSSARRWSGPVLAAPWAEELKTNTELTRAIHRLTSELHERVVGTDATAAKDSTMGPPNGSAHAP